MERPIIVLFVIALFGLNPALKAQNSLEGYLDVGKNQVSQGVYSQISNIGCFEKAKWGVKGGFQLGLVQPQDVIFNSCYISSYGKIRTGKMPLYLGGEYLWTSFSPVMRETNWILFARTRLTHWQFGFGTSIRTYRFSNKATNNADQLYPDRRITEKWNMMYDASYSLKLYENKWNLTGTFTNYDHFIIQQENNPMFNFRFDYKPGSNILLYSELWYKPAGLMVIRVTYYGMFIRLGLLWNI